MPAAAILGDEIQKLVATDNAPHHQRMTLFSSSAVTVAVPRFMTTIPPA
jgi:hypothetical protein